MPNPIVAIAGSSLIGGAMQSRAASKAADAQSQSAQAGIEEQRRQFDEIRRLLAPYVEVGTPALEAQRALLGLGGAGAQQQAIRQIERSPFFQSQIEQGERAMLQRAGATGGLRGGNLQAGLAQFRPALLQEAINQQYARLGGMTSLGQQSAAGVGTAGQAMGGNISNLLQQQGAAQAGGILGRTAPFAQMAQLPMQMAGLNMMTGGSGFGGLFSGNPIQAGFSQTGLGSSGFGTGLAYGNQDLGQYFSDRRLKRDVRRISTRKDGLGVYSFEYVWGGGRHIGLMAQEVINVYPEAVGSIGDFMTVNYSMIPEA